MIYNDPVTYARSMIMKGVIEGTILEMVFGGISMMGTRKNIAVEIDRVINDVCDSMNLLFGELIDIPLSDCQCIDNGLGKTFYVPPLARKNRDIRNVMSINHNITSVMGMMNVNTTGNSVTAGMSRVFDSMSPNIIVGSSYIEMEDSNTFRITGDSIFLSGMEMVTIDLENRTRLKRLRKGSYPLFAKIATKYVEAYIYSKRITLKKVAILGGYEMSDIESVISEFSGSRTEYDQLMDEDAGKMGTFADESKLNAIYSNIV